MLQASNPEFADVHVADESDLHIWGVVTRVLRAV
jgi:SOS-response transcriptional repressor LexA